MRTFLAGEAEGVWAELGEGVAVADCSGEIEGEADSSVVTEGAGVVGSCAAAKEMKIADSNAKVRLIMSKGVGDTCSLSCSRRASPLATAGNPFFHWMTIVKHSSASSHLEKDCRATRNRAKNLRPHRWR